MNLEFEFMKPNMDKFESLISEHNSDWHKDADERRVNKAWKDKAFDIALNIINYKNKHNLTQVQLADKIGVSKQYINRVLQGKENLTLESICKIEEALNIMIIDLNLYNYTVEEFDNQISTGDLISFDKDIFTKIANPYDEYLPIAG